jgi:hypothetical protein
MEGSTGAGRRLPPLLAAQGGQGWPLLFCGAGDSAFAERDLAFAERDLEADVAYGMTSPAGDPARGAIGFGLGWPRPRAYVRHTAAA